MHTRVWLENLIKEPFRKPRGIWECDITTGIHKLGLEVVGYFTEFRTGESGELL
jgi:hypothetical protein